MKELCRLIASLDLPLSITDCDAWDEYIQCGQILDIRVSRFTTSRDLAKLYNEKLHHLKNEVFLVCLLFV